MRPSVAADGYTKSHRRPAHPWVLELTIGLLLPCYPAFLPGLFVRGVCITLTGDCGAGGGSDGGSAGAGGSGGGEGDGGGDGGAGGDPVGKLFIGQCFQRRKIPVVNGCLVGHKREANATASWCEPCVKGSTGTPTSQVTPV